MGPFGFAEETASRRDSIEIQAIRMRHFLCPGQELNRGPLEWLTSVLPLDHRTTFFLTYNIYE
ncbi:hypothetical protein DPMN_143080 [Dreissena polymorpha]|uniref:Uncharacterized protein n=1 Tax=Dreissena polymorpha TaxID=45954 RepID=A0A9D4GC98_DREPO|nr:hypothetical protein DPMN_143080 [Dreissena polymorpha]